MFYFNFEKFKIKILVGKNVGKNIHYLFFRALNEILQEGGYDYLTYFEETKGDGFRAILGAAKPVPG